MSHIYGNCARVVASIAAAGLISACSSQAGSGALPGSNPSNAAPASSKTFHFTRTPQTFKVPSGVTRVTISAQGAVGGGPAKMEYGYPGARGAKITATVSVKPGQVLTVLVGSKGIAGGSHGEGGGYNGGGGAYYAYGGGGSSDVRAGTTVADRIVVAGGGGGGGESFEFENASSSFYWCYGGKGGIGGAKSGSNGEDGACETQPGGGYGGTESSGGAGGRGGPYGGSTLGGSPGCAGNYGDNGAFLTGGEGGQGCAGSGGGGGGGYFGGGGGGSGGCCSEYGAGGSGGGGGGGSSYVEPSATNVHRTAGGGPDGNGVVTINW
jgi:hypothetical protein